MDIHSILLKVKNNELSLEEAEKLIKDSMCKACFEKVTDDW